MFTQFNLDPQLMKAIEALDYSAPTPVQLQAIPAALAGDDIMVCAETGSGKTAAFVLPTLHKLINKKAPNSATRVLILAPTRELARQLFKQCEALAKFTGIEAGLITGGESFKFQAATFRKNPEIIVSTPGRLIDHLGRKPNLMNDVEVLVLDEADRMLDMGFAEDVMAIANHCDEQKQTMLFSATMNQKGIRHVIKQVLNDPTTITVDAIKGSHGNIKQQIMLADDDQHKDRLLTWMLANETYRQCIIFSNTKAKTDELYHFLRYHKHKVGVLHGDMTQDERNHIMSRMQQGHVSVLVATDVASRGLDVKNIDLVVNFDLPRSGDDYVHRIGRTGRAGEQGLAVSLVDHSEWNLKASIERYLKIELEVRKVKALLGKYKGPKKVKSNGKPVGKKKKDVKKAVAKKSAGKKPANKQRRSPAKPSQAHFGDGTAPFKKR
ncbi:RNA helicase [Bermanella sp. 47_1433_sub80_T6]|nr:RNA helicase [Bermanella sp. 47_1433_sub80_T6]